MYTFLCSSPSHHPSSHATYLFNLFVLVSSNFLYSSANVARRKEKQRVKERGKPPNSPSDIYLPTDSATTEKFKETNNLHHPAGFNNTSIVHEPPIRANTLTNTPFTQARVTIFEGLNVFDAGFQSLHPQRTPKALDIFREALCTVRPTHAEHQNVGLLALSKHPAGGTWNIIKLAST